ncbi:MAG: PorP/SprF family type IX secretion system membrane protein [Bacteroidia bacterium]|nr:PorP/SprF family type IX secretion system membrane protein [Bacteroidia bacterium]
MRNKTKIIFLFLILQSANSFAQDIHFSQYLNAPLLLNPSLTGNSDYIIRSGLNYRNQWSSFTVPFITQSAYADGMLQPKKLKNDWLGVGGVFYNDQAGDGNLKTTKGILFGSYTKSFNRVKTFYGGVGLGIGFANRSLNYSRLYFESQWIGYRFDTYKETGEHISDESFFYFDMNAGCFMKYIQPKRFEFHIGASFNHLNQPYNKFYSYRQRMGMKTVVHCGMTIIINEQIYLKPDVMFTYLKKTDELVAGALFSYKLDESFLYLGCWTRTGRDIIHVAGFYYAGFRLLASYDINVSDLTVASRQRGGFEISLTKCFFLADNMMGTKFKAKGGVPKFSAY